VSITDRAARGFSIDCDWRAGIAYFGAMYKIRAYAFLAVLLLFTGYFGVYGFYNTLADSIGTGWALAGAGVIAVGTFVIAAVGITMIMSRPPERKDVQDE